jgi:hypothetical protein
VLGVAQLRVHVQIAPERDQLGLAPGQELAELFGI